MPVAVNRFLVQLLHFFLNMRLFIKRRLIGRRLVYATLSLIVILFVTVQYSYGRPNGNDEVCSNTQCNHFCLVPTKRCRRSAGQL